jgi:hypothetical protein
MPFSAPTPVISGKPYLVIKVRDHPPTTLDDFLGETSFVLNLDGAPYPVRGSGAAMAKGVHVHEKDAQGSGKDIRVWAIHAGPTDAGSTPDEFTAEHVSHGGPPGTYFE